MATAMQKKTDARYNGWVEIDYPSIHHSARVRVIEPGRKSEAARRCEPPEVSRVFSVADR